MRVLAADAWQRLELGVRVEDVETIAAEERELPRRGERVPAPLELVGGVRPAALTEHVDHLAEDPNRAPGPPPLSAVEQVDDDLLEPLGNAAGRIVDCRHGLFGVRDDEQAGFLRARQAPTARVEVRAEQLDVVGRDDEDSRLVALEPHGEKGRNRFCEVGRVRVDLDPVRAGAGAAEELSPGLAHRSSLDPFATTVP